MKDNDKNKYPKGFTLIDNRINYCGLSLKEIGLFTVLSVLPPDYPISYESLKGIVKDRDKAINTTIKSAIKNGILEREKKRNKKTGTYEYVYKLKLPP